MSRKAKMKIPVHRRWWEIRILAVAIVIGLLVGSPIANASNADHLIVPGVGIGPVHIGDNIRNVVKTLGAARSVTTDKNLPPPQTVYFWGDKDNGGLSVHVLNGIVTRVGVTADGSYATREGLHTATLRHGIVTAGGSSEQEVRSILGKPDDEIDHADEGLLFLSYNKGITVLVYRSSRGVVVIQVLRF